VNITAKELSGLHVGKTLIFNGQESKVINVEHDGEQVAILFADFEQILVNPNTPITIQEGK
jgi:hypothetical protein